MSDRVAAPNTVPPGWRYNPSAWEQRLPIIGLGVLGMCIGFYLAGFQLGLTSTVWDPVFDGGSRRVLTSSVSHLFPTSDALLGGLGYAFDWIFGLLGGTDRWRTRPYLVVLFGIGIVPFGWVSISLGLAMRAIVGSWCFLYLCSTTISVIMIPFSWDEIWATLVELRRRVRAGTPVWAALLGRGEG